MVMMAEEVKSGNITTARVVMFTFAFVTVPEEFEDANPAAALRIVEELESTGLGRVMYSVNVVWIVSVVREVWVVDVVAVGSVSAVGLVGFEKERMMGG